MTHAFHLAALLTICCLGLFAEASTPLEGGDYAPSDSGSLKGGAGGLFDTGTSQTALSSDGSISEYSAGALDTGALGTLTNISQVAVDEILLSDFPDDYDWMISALAMADKTGASDDEIDLFLSLLDQSLYDTTVGTETATWGQFVGDPVDSVSGAFVVDEVDLTLAGPLPIQIRRSYNSQNGIFGLLGYGWKLNTMPFIVVMNDQSGGNTKNSIIQAAELDGTVVEYVKDATGNVWRASNRLKDGSAVNPHFSNATSAGIGATVNLLSQRVEMVSNITDPWVATAPKRNRYTIKGADGSIREYYERPFAQGAIERRRPYLYKWSDAQGNFLTFHYGLNPSYWDYGQLVKIVSSNGSLISFEYNSPGQVVAAFTNDGRRLAYEYDGFGDLVSVKLPDGSTHRYTYKRSTSAPDGSGAIIDEYSTHLLRRIVKPEGRTLENDYDDQRRVVEQRATVGQGLELVRNATFVYSHPESSSAPVTGWTRIYDAFNLPSVDPATDTNCLRYDYVDGLITAITDPLGHVIQQEWYVDRVPFPDAVIDPATQANFVLPIIATDPGLNQPAGYRRSLKRTTDKRGLVTHFWYDERGNLILQKATGELTGDGLEPETRVVNISYSAATNLPVTSQQAVENVSGLLTSSQEIVYDITYPYLPRTVTQLVEAVVVSKTEMGYGVAGTGSVQAKGLLQSRINALGTSDSKHVRMEYDGRGFLTRRIEFSEKGLASTPFVSSNSSDSASSYYYNSRAELVREVDSGNRRKEYAYDPMGRLTRSAVFNDSGDLLSASNIYYNLNGEVSWIDGPKSGPEDYVFNNYDADGRRIAEVRWRSRAKSDGSGIEAIDGQNELANQSVTEYEYDAFDNLRKQIGPNGDYVIQSFDAIGQLTRRESYEGKTDRLLSLEDFFYEPGGKVSRSVNAAGGVTKYFYTSGGQIRRQENPDGTSLEWRYTIDGRVKEEILPNQAKWITAYDDAARTISRKYHGPPALGSPAGTTGPLLATESRILDRLGNVTSVTDLDGNTSTTTYDALGRPKIFTGPAASDKSEQQTTTYSYDLLNLSTTVTNALSQVTTNTLDALGRPIRSEVKSAPGATVPVSLVTHEYAPDHNSVTTIRGDVTTGEAYSKSTTFTDTFGKPLLTHLYRGSGTRDVIRNVYDLAGNLVESFDARGQSTTMTYDGAGRLISQRLPDGARTDFAYDPLGNLIKRAMPGGLTWTAFYDNSGRMFAEELIGSDMSRSRKYSHAFYDSGPYVGLPKESRDLLRGVASTTTEYDSFRRPKAISITSGGDLKGLTQAFAYNNRGQIVEHAQDYADSTLPTTKVLRQFDGYGQLTREQVLVDDIVRSTVDQYWNSAARRSRVDGDIGSITPPARRYDFLHRADGLMQSVTEKFTGQNRLFQFNYDRSGQLTSRVNPWRSQAIHSRDLQGRILSTSTALAGQPEPFLQEALTWREDGRLATYASPRTGTWSQARAYAYNARGQLVNETYSPAPDESASIAYAYDQDGLGVRTSAVPSALVDARWRVASGGLDSLARIIQESTGVPNTLPAHGFAAGAGSVRLDLHNLGTGRTHPVQGVLYNPEQEDGRWDADLDLSVGSYELQARSVSRDRSVTSAPAISRFRVTADPSPRIYTDYDQAGYAVRRIWSSRRTQRLVWDVLGRLLRVDDYGDGQAGTRWAAIYDAGGRRLETRTDLLSPLGAPVAGDRVTEKSLYDPQIEFLELAVNISSASNPGDTFWKVYGPDLNGVYGALQGIGGLEATIRQSNQQVAAVVHDVWGHGVASISGDLGATELLWNETQVSGYGLLPGQVSKTLGLSEGATTTLQLATATVWRGHRIDPTGLYNLGARYYEPQSGRFLSPDPLGHAASMSLYDYAYGDPINFMDPDGRLSKATFQTGAKFFDAVFNGIFAGLFSPSNPQAFTPEEINRMAMANVKAYGSPFQKMGAYEETQATRALVETLPVNLAPAVVDMSDGYTALRPTVGARPNLKPDVIREPTGGVGEVIAKNWLEVENKYTDVLSIQNKSGNGLDLIGRSPEGHLGFFEVKTTASGSVPDLKPRQQSMSYFVSDVLTNAANGTGRYQNLDENTRTAARALLEEYSSNPDRAVGTVVGIAINPNDGSVTITISNWSK